MQEMHSVNDDARRLAGANLAATFSLELAWPSPALSPNGRLHWAKLASAKKAYRARCRAAGAPFAAVLAPTLARHPNARLGLVLTFLPPDRRRRDMDNLLASMKAGLDGLADAWGVDDSRWRLAMEMGEPTTGGLVLVDVGVIV